MPKDRHGGRSARPLNSSFGFYAAPLKVAVMPGQYTLSPRTMRHKSFDTEKGMPAESERLFQGCTNKAKYEPTSWSRLST